MLQSSGPIGTLDPSKKIHIIGGGFSGLIMGYYLKKQGIDFTLYEKAPDIGGKISTRETDYGLVESAANAIYANDKVYQLLEELKLDPLRPTSNLRKAVWRNHKFSSPPVSALEVFKLMFKLFKTPPQNESQSLFDFFAPVLGKNFTEEVVAAGFVGIYGVDIKELHFKSIFKDADTSSYLNFIRSMGAKKKAQKQRLQSLSFKTGMIELMKTLENEIRSHIVYGSSDLPDNNLLICTSSYDAAKILKPLNENMARALEEIEYAPLTSTTVFSEQEIPLLKKHFGGVIAPKTKGIDTIGILANSEIFQGRVKKDGMHSYTFIMQGLRNEVDLNRDIKSLGLDKYINPSAPKYLKTWERALPIYNKHRFEAILKLRSQCLESEKKIALFGNYIDGIALRELVGHAEDFSKKLKSAI